MSDDLLRQARQRAEMRKTLEEARRRGEEKRLAETVEDETKRSWLGEVGAGVVRGAMGLPAAGAQAVAAGASAVEEVVGDTALTNAAQSYASTLSTVRDINETAHGYEADPKRPYAAAIGEGVPQVGLAVGVGLATGGAGLPAALSAFAGTSAAPVVGQVYEESKRETGSRGKAVAEAGIAGAVTMATSFIPGAAILSRVPGGQRLLSQVARNVVGRLTLAAAAEGAQEYTEGFVQELTRELVRRDQSLTPELVGQALTSPDRMVDLVAGGVLGGVAKGAVDTGRAVTGTDQASITQPEPAPPPEPPTETPQEATEDVEPTVEPPEPSEPAEGDQEALVGRPELANPATDSEARAFVDQVDEQRKAAGTPQPQTFAEWKAEADAKLAADYEGERQRLLDMAEGQGTFRTPGDVIAAQTIINDAAMTAATTGDPRALEQAMALANAERTVRTEQARAMTAMRDQVMSPAERLKLDVAEAVTAVPDRAQARIDTATEKLAATDQSTPWGKRRAERLAGKKRKLTQAQVDKAEKRAAYLRSQGIVLDQMSEAELNDPAMQRKIRKALTQMTAGESGWLDKSIEYWRNAILSHPKTFIVNATGYTYGAWEMTAQRALRAAINVAVKDPDSPTFREFHGMAENFMPGLIQGAKNAWAAFDTEAPVFADQIAQAKRAKGQAFSEEHLSTKLDARDQSLAIGGKKGRLIRVPQRVLLATDELAKTFLGTMEAGMIAHRLATQAGLEGDAKRDAVSAAMNDKTHPLWESALTEAERVAFQTPLGRTGKAFLRIRNSVRPLTFLFPFVTTPTNLFKRSFEKLPGGGTLKLALKAKAGEADRSQVVETVANEIVAWSLLLALGSFVWDEDEDRPRITGTLPYGGARDAGYREGVPPPMSIRIGDEYYSYARLDPIATTLATMIDGLNEIKAVTDAGKDADKAVVDWLTGFRDQVQEKTFLQGISDIMRVIESDDPVEGLGRWASGFGASWVPNIVRGTARSADPHIRETRVWGDDPGVFWNRTAARMVEGAFPGHALKTPPKVDLWGRDITKGTPGDIGKAPATTFAWEMLSPVRVHEDAQPFVGDIILLHWNQQNPNEEYWPRPPAPYFSRKIGGKDVRFDMTDAEYHDFMAASGTMAREAIQSLVDREIITETMIAEPKQTTVDAIERILSRARSSARDRIMRDRVLSLREQGLNDREIVKSLQGDH